MLRRSIRAVTLAACATQFPNSFCSELERRFVPSCSTYPANDPIEDRHLVGTMGPWEIAAVFDGHGGHQVAHFAKDNLVPCIVQNLNESGDVNSIISSFKEIDAKYEEVIRGAYKLGFGDVSSVGSCVCVALLDRAKRQLIVANLGDCRAVVGREVTNWMGTTQWHSNQVTKDHNARLPQEQERLMREHPNERDIVVCKSEHACYVKGRLQLTKALGDLYLKSAEYNAPEGSHRSMGRRIPNPYTPPYVGNAPDVFSVNVQANDRYVILATDGVWDYVSPQEAVEITAHFVQGYKKYCEIVSATGKSVGAEGLILPDTVKPYQGVFVDSYAQIHQRVAIGTTGMSAEELVRSQCATVLVDVALYKAAHESKLTPFQLKQLPVGKYRRMYHDDTTAVVMFL